MFFGTLDYFYIKNAFTYYLYNLKINKLKSIHSFIDVFIDLRLHWCCGQKLVVSPLAIPSFLFANLTLVFRDGTFQAEHLLSPPSLQLQIARRYILANET